MHNGWIVYSQRDDHDYRLGRGSRSHGGVLEAMQNLSIRHYTELSIGAYRTAVTRTGAVTTSFELNNFE